MEPCNPILKHPSFIKMDDCTVWTARDETSNERNSYEIMCFFSFEISSLTVHTVLFRESHVNAMT